MRSTGITITDFIIAITYIVGVLGIGIYFSRKQKSAKDFLIANRSMSWLPVGLSLMATLTSAVGYMAYPAGAFEAGLILLWMAMAIPLSLPMIIYVFMPVYHKLKIVTAYEYLERRFNDKVRALASAIFILWRLTWLAAVIYVPALVLDVVTDGKIPLAPTIIVMGVISTVKTALGGLKAVMCGDVVHSFVMFLGLFICLIFIFTALPGGLSEIWNTLVIAGKTNMIAQIHGMAEVGFIQKVRLYFVTDFTVGALILTYTVQKMGNYCVDQALVQRYICAKSLKEAKKGFYANAVSYLLYIFLVTAIGAGLFAVSKHIQFPSGLNFDDYFPYFIANYLPVGLSGLMIAAICAASLSSIDGGVNSITTAVLNDYYSRYILKNYNLEVGEDTQDEKARRLKLTRILTIFIGIAITILAFSVQLLGNIFTYSQSLINMFTGPLFGVFFLGFFTKNATAFGTLICVFIGFVVDSLLVFAKTLHINQLAIGVLWPAFISFAVTIVLGYFLSMVFGKNTESTLNYTRRNIMKKNWKEYKDNSIVRLK